MEIKRWDLGHSLGVLPKSGGRFVTHEDYLAKIKSLEDENVFLKEAINKIWEVASGESQVAMDDTAGMEWISDYTSSLWDNDEVLTETVEGK
jgi:hypothetical protein